MSQSRCPCSACPKSSNLHTTDAMLAQYMPWPRVCLSVCLSVTSRCFIKTAERIELVFRLQRLLSTYAALIKFQLVVRQVHNKSNQWSLSSRDWQKIDDIRASPKIRVFPSGTLFHTVDFETKQVSQLKQGLADRTAKTAVSVAI